LNWRMYVLNFDQVCLLHFRSLKSTSELLWPLHGNSVHTYIPSFSTSLSMTPPMWISPVTLSDTSLLRLWSLNNRGLFQTRYKTKSSAIE
uniref:Uncharacterized protein n=1 Tax=Cyclopterus lumpus TaxID=8103 RepID=A0A8C3ATB5_CYCLU